MSLFGASDRTRCLDDWQGLADDARSLAETPGNDPFTAFLIKAEVAAVWAWPRPGQVRCRALQQLAKLYALANADERAVLAGPMRCLARSVAEAVEEARPRSPAERKDIEA